MFKIEIRKNDNLCEDRLTEWQRKANKWSIKISYKDREMTLNFFTGKGIKGQNAIAYNVLYSLFNDAAIAENTKDLAEFLEEFGYCDNAKLVREGITTFKAIRKEAKRFRKLLGDDFSRMITMYNEYGEDFIEQVCKETETVYIA